MNKYQSGNFEPREKWPRAMIRAQRQERGLAATVPRSGHRRLTEFPHRSRSRPRTRRTRKTLAILAALGLSLEATDSIPRGSDYDPARRDYAQTFTQLTNSGDYEFAIKMLADYASASLKAGRPLVQRSPRLKEPHWSAPLAGITNYTAHRLRQPAPSWTRRIKPLSAAWMPAESYRRIREPMKQLTILETPPEIAAMNVSIRERSLATA